MSPIVSGEPVDKMGTKPSNRRREVGLIKRPFIVAYSGWVHRFMSSVRLVTKGRPYVSTLLLEGLFSERQFLVIGSQAGCLDRLVSLN